MGKSPALTFAALLAALPTVVFAQNSTTDGGVKSGAVTPPSPHYMSGPKRAPYNGRSSSNGNPTLQQTDKADTAPKSGDEQRTPPQQ
jgi:hypothetical protein